MYALFSSITSNAFLNHMVVYVMPGEGLELGPWMSAEEARRKRPSEVVETARTREAPLTGFGVTLPEARTLVSLVALSGVVYPLAGVMPELPDERLDLLKKTLPPQAILPMDLFSRGTDMEWDTFKHVRPDDYLHHYPELVDLKVNAPAGIYDVVALPNWRSESVVKPVSFVEQLGLEAGVARIAFDFWNQKLLGVFQDRLEVHIPGHDTRVILLHPALDHPQLLATSRHITGACSILEQSWDGANQVLRGISEPVPGADYTLFIHVPSKVAFARVKAASGRGEEPSASHQRQGNLLTVSFAGPQAVLNWQLQFVNAPTR
jgi:hypothetical protein